MPIADAVPTIIEERGGPGGWVRVEERLEDLARQAAGAGEELRRRLEEEALRLLEPLGRTLVRRMWSPDAFAAEARLGQFRLFVIEAWRRRVGPGAAEEALARRVADFLNGVRAPLLIGEGRELHVGPCGVCLGELSPELLARVAARPGLDRSWAAFLARLARAGEKFRPGRGGFAGWIFRRFSWRLKDFVQREEHCVRRSGRTERRRRAAGGAESAWGYEALGPGGLDPVDRAAALDMSRAEARVELEALLGRLPPADRTFLRPLTEGEVEDLKGLAARRGVSPAAVSRRVARIRLRAGTIDGGVPVPAFL